jgi:hypothetical protein
VVKPSSLRAARIMTGLGLPTLNALAPVAISSRQTKVSHTNAIKITCNFLLFLYFRRPGERDDLLR